jgi:hypothetical protein
VLVGLELAVSFLRLMAISDSDCARAVMSSMLAVSSSVEDADSSEAEAVSSAMEAMPSTALAAVCVPSF